jgi:hypothetical protein
VPENDWDERELRDEELDSSSWEGGSRTWLPWALWALIPIGLGLLWLSLRGGEPDPQATESSAPIEPAPAPASSEVNADVGEPVKLPPLSESDSFFRDRVRMLSTHAFLALLLDADDLVRKLVVSVANVAEGASPAKQIPHVKPEEPFSALETAERTVIDPASYRRYDAPAELFSSLDASAVAGLYRTLEPLLEEAHSELGLSERRGFRDTLSRAIEVLLAAPALEGPIRLRAVNVNYAFEDPALEKLSPAQKHLIRMGPSNTRRVQRKLTEIKGALALR